jgi:ribosomal protein L11 methyltransferase
VAEDVVDRLIDLGALDVDASHDVVTALMPDSISAAALADALEVDRITVSAARSRDGGSVWVLAPRPVRVGRVHIVPADAAADACALRLIDAGAFGTGLHPTTSLCLEILDDALHTAPADAVLDVGTGSGVLALAALKLGVPRATGIDVDDEALRVARKNARLNRLDARFQLIRGGPDAVDGRWPLVLANVLAAPLIEMAPVLVRRLGRHAQLVLSGIPASVEPDVDRVYRRLGLRRLRVLSRDGWVALVLQASW